MEINNSCLIFNKIISEITDIKYKYNSCWYIIYTDGVLCTYSHFSHMVQLCIQFDHNLMRTMNFFYSINYTSNTCVHWIYIDCTVDFEVELHASPFFSIEDIKLIIINIVYLIIPIGILTIIKHRKLC